MQGENRHATEVLMTAFECLVERAGARGWPLDLVVDAAFRAGASLSMAHLGIPQTAEHCRSLADDLERLCAQLEKKQRVA